MIACLNRIREDKIFSDSDNNLPSDRLRVSFNTARTDEDLIPDPSILDLVDTEKRGEIRTAVETMNNTASDNGLPPEHNKVLEEHVGTHIDMFRTSFSAGPPARIKPLRIALTPDARPVKVRLRNYSQEQRGFFKNFVAKLVRNGVANPNLTSPWTCALLLVYKPGAARFWFTFDLRPVNRLTVRHQYPMPNLRHELTKLSESRFLRLPICRMNIGSWSWRRMSRNCNISVHQTAFIPDKGSTRHDERRYPPATFTCRASNVWYAGNHPVLVG